MSGICVVGCKLPNGLIVELGKPGTSSYKRITLQGANASRIVGGYGLTPNVDKDAMESWLKQNAELAYVKNGSVFIQADTKSAEARAKEGRNEKTGLEPVNPLEKRPGIVVDEEAAKAYRKQVAENPTRNRQIIE